MIKVLKLDWRFQNKLDNLYDKGIYDISYKNLSLDREIESIYESIETEHYLVIYIKNKYKEATRIYWDRASEYIGDDTIYILYNEKKDTFIITDKKDFQVIKDSLEYEYIRLKDLMCE